MKCLKGNDFLKHTSLGLGCLLATASVNGAPASGKPNMIWIMADDLGSGDLGCYGAKDLLTPHIDSLAREGVKCERFYAAAPVCSPSRACTLTGRYPDALGIKGALMGEGGLPGNAVTIAKVLKQSGYATGLVGKWHLGYEGKSLPNSQGFDLFYGFRGGKIDYFKHTDTAQKVKGENLGKHDFYENEKEIFPEGYSTGLFTQRAVQFVEDHKAGPFFLLLSYNAPHYARPGVLQAPEETIRRFAKEGKPSLRQLYAAMVSGMDDGVGEVLACLKKNGLEDNTLVMFVSDNGADPGNGGSNTPFTNGKWKFTEGGIRVPMIVKWPGKLPAGAMTREPVHMIDLFPTALAVAGVAKPPDLKLDGLDALDVLKGKRTFPERSLYFGKDVVIRGKWKLINSRLYDLETDPGEREDLAQKYPEVLRTLMHELQGS
jgi:arylsulfatase A-like enzyme